MGYQQLMYDWTVKNNMSNSLVHSITPLGWLACIFTISSVLLAMYILCFLVKLKWNQFKYDGHYRLRLLLAVVLVLNRFIHVMNVYFNLEIIYKKSLDESYNVLRESTTYVLFEVTFYVDLMLLLFLAMNRYERIAVQSGPWIRRMCIVVQLMYACVVVYVSIGYGLLNVTPIVDPEGYRENQLLQSTANARFPIEVTMLLSGMVLYYFFTLQILVACIKSLGYQGNGNAMKTLWIYVMYTPKDQRESVDVQTKKLVTATKMIIYFLSFFMVDLFILFGGHFLGRQVGALSDQEYKCFAAFAYSWLPFHIFFNFKFLDMFLRNWKEASSKKGKRKSSKTLGSWLIAKSFRRQGRKTDQAREDAVNEVASDQPTDAIALSDYVSGAASQTFQLSSLK